MRRGFFIMTVIALAAIAAKADGFRGRLLDAVTGEPVAGAIIRISGGRSYTSSDARGRFSLSEGVSGFSVRCMGYEDMELTLPLPESDIRLTPKETKLREVVVSAPDIYQRGDTLVFNVGKYATAADNAILDVIRRLPGIKVEDDGQIMYNGKPINKFYIDGNDFVGDRYGLATNNISKDDVAAVEVMENHQPIKALEDIEFSEQAGINLKLKEDARSRWVGVATAGTGVAGPLYTGGLFTMRLARKMQNMFTVKADNTGWNPDNEIRDTGYDPLFSGDFKENRWEEYITADRVDSPLSESRIRDNLSCLANAITSWGNNDVSKRLTVNYSGDRIDYHTGFTTDYFSPDIENFTQENALRTFRQALSGEMRTEVNRRNYFLKNNFTLAAGSDRSRSAITGSMDLVQKIRRKSLMARNDLRLIRKTDEQVFSLSSRNEYSRNLSDLNIADRNGNPSQTVRVSDFRSITESRYGWFAGYWRVYLTGNLDLEYRRLDAALKDFDCNFIRSADNGAFLASFTLTPQAEYEQRGWRINVSAPVGLTHYGINGSHRFLCLSPNVRVRRQLGAKSDVTLSAAYSSSAPAPSMFVSCVFLTDYRNLYAATPSERNEGNTFVSATYRYRNPLSSFFANVSGSFSYSRSPLITDRLFSDGFIVTTFRPLTARTYCYMLKGGVSKGFVHGRLVGGMDAGFSRTKSASMRDGVRIPFRQDCVTLNPYFKGSLCRWLSMHYSLDAAFNLLKISGTSPDRSSSLSQELSFTYMPVDNLNVVMGAEHYFTDFGEGGRKSGMVLLDASATWLIGPRTRLSLAVSNLLDRHTYSYTTFGPLSRTDYNYRIRPRELLATLQIRF